MANFVPFKDYLIFLIDKLIKKHHLTGPFLDAGCGNGELTLHLARRNWQGRAIDISNKAAMETKRKLMAFSHVRAEEKNIFHEKNKYQTIFLCDVLEHLKDDKKVLNHLVNLLNKNGHLIISVPICQKEWRWDDEYYGHVRRYSIKGLTELLKDNGFKIIEFWDFTFPFFWILRRIYTCLLPKKLIIGSQKQLTKISASRNAWDAGVFTKFFPRFFWWQPIFEMQYRFRNQIRGCECLILARENK